jgi:hypothetical protein
MDESVMTAAPGENGSSPSVASARDTVKSPADEPVPTADSAGRFARLFRGYGVSLGMIVAAVPFATAGFDAIPMYASHRWVLSAVAGTISLLAVAVVFSLRRTIGTAVFPPRRRLSLTRRERARQDRLGLAWPLTIAVTSVVAFGLYLGFMDASIELSALKYAVAPPDVPLAEALESLRTAPPGQSAKRVTASLFGDARPEMTVYGHLGPPSEKAGRPREPVVRFQSQAGVNLVLSSTPSLDIPYEAAIKCFYVVMFLGLSISFVWFGLIEYLQQELGYPDRALIERPYVPAEVRWYRVPEVQDAEGGKSVWFQFEYSLEGTTVEGIGAPFGPICGDHDRVLRFGSCEGAADYRWHCIKGSGKEEKVEHTVRLRFDQVEIVGRARTAMTEELKRLGPELPQEGRKASAAAAVAGLVAKFRIAD